MNRWLPVILCTAACQSTSWPSVQQSISSSESSLTDIALQEVRSDPSLDFVVKSRIYPEEPESMVLTLRGGGISIMDVTDPSDPTLLARALEGQDVEGQDRVGDLLVVVARNGCLFTLDVSDSSNPQVLSELVLVTGPDLLNSLAATFLNTFGGGPFTALHTVLHTAPDGRLIAFVTATASAEVIAIDVSNPLHPIQVGSVSTDVTFIEGIEIVHDVAWVGGFGNAHLYSGIDVSMPEQMEVIEELEHPWFHQMVPAIDPAHPDLLFAAMWGDPGGLAIFDTTIPGQLEPVALLGDTALAKSNRVKIDGDLAWLPLEQTPGGIAAIDIATPSHPELVTWQVDVPGVTKPYTAQPHEGFLYLFGTEEASMAIFEID